ncbi:MAG: acyltransferase [Gemmataceae bacterium]
MAKPDQLPSLDGIRAVCIVFVIGAHANRSHNFPAHWIGISGYIFNGSLGVHIFFVLSGFLITYLLLKEEDREGSVSLKNFYIRRCFRILPVFIAYISALACLEALTSLEISRYQYVSSFTFTKNYWQSTWIDGHLWSLSVEEQFYLFWPVLFVFAPKKWRFFSATILITSAPVFRVWFYVAKWSGLKLYSFMTNMDSLMIGSATALLVWSCPQIVERILSWRPWLGRLIAIAIVYVIWVLQLNFLAGIFTVPFAITVQATAAAYLIASYSLKGGGIGFVLLNFRPIRYFGILSYSIYIWQQPFFSQPSTFGVDKTLVLDFPFNIAFAISVSAISYHCLEKPLLGIRKRFSTSNESPKLTKS